MDHIIYATMIRLWCILWYCWVVPEIMPSLDSAERDVPLSVGGCHGQGMHHDVVCFKQCTEFLYTYVLIPMLIYVVFEEVPRSSVHAISRMYY